MKQKRAVLYELLSQREPPHPGDQTPNGHHGDPPSLGPADVNANESPDWLGPGSSLRIPVGYIFVAVAAVITLFVVAYIFGFSHGTDDPDALPDQNLSARLEQQRIASAQMGQDGTRSNSGSSANGRGAATGSPRGWGLTESDPREVGLNYFFIVHTTRDNAILVANFCRTEGLEAYVVKANNSSSRGVYVVPGYQREDRATEPIRRLEDRIRRVIQKWNVHVGRDDLTTYVPQKYKG